jgi:hypothetical protein
VGIIDKYREKCGPAGKAVEAGPWDFDFDRPALCGIALRDPASLLWKLGPAEDPEKALLGSHRWYSRGVEVGVANGKVDSFVLVFQDLAGQRFSPFSGPCQCQGQIVLLKPAQTEAEVTALLGKPLWREHSEGEILLFYPKGDTHWQVELSEAGGLAAIEILAAPLLAETPAAKS